MHNIVCTVALAFSIGVVVHGLVIPDGKASVGTTLFPFGPLVVGNTLHSTPSENDCKPYNFKAKLQGGKETSKIYVCTNGVISFDAQFTGNPDPINGPNYWHIPISGSDSFIAPLFNDHYTDNYYGKIWSQGDMTMANNWFILSAVENMINNGFFEPEEYPYANKFVVAEAVMATWDKVRTWRKVGGVSVPDEAESSFQCIIVRDANSTTYAVFIYGRLEWGTDQMDSQVGFQDYVPNIHYYNLNSEKPSNVDIRDYVTGNTNTHDSNLNGLWIYKMATEIDPNDHHGIVKQPKTTKVGQSCTKTQSDYCNTRIKLASCKTVTTGGVTSDRCQCGPNAEPFGLTCICKPGFYMKRKLNPELLSIEEPRYSCEPAFPTEYCEGPYSERACEGIPGSECQDVSGRRQCGCKTNYYLEYVGGTYVCDEDIFSK